MIKHFKWGLGFNEMKEITGLQANTWRTLDLSGQDNLFNIQVSWTHAAFFDSTGAYNFFYITLFTKTTVKKKEIKF